MKEHVYPPPFGDEADCICPDSWRKDSPRNHTDRCEAAYNARQRAKREQKTPPRGVQRGAR